MMYKVLVWFKESTVGNRMVVYSNVFQFDTKEGAAEACKFYHENGCYTKWIRDSKE